MKPSLSTVFSQLQSCYHKAGLTVYGGFSPFITGGNNFGLCNYIASEKILLSSSGGIANDEAMFLHFLCNNINPSKVLVIGNSYGFSTVFLSLCLPNSQVVAFDKFRTEGIKVTNKLLEGLPNKQVIQGSTPDDIPIIIDNYFNGEIDFVLIDAVHTNEMQTAEFKILDKYLTNNSVVVFHDVLSCDLLDSFFYLRDSYKEYKFHLLHKTSTGLGLAFKGELNEELNNLINYFSMDIGHIFNFETKMSKHRSSGISKLFENCKTEFNFPSHPQL